MTEFTVYTQAGRACPWCDKATELLHTQGRSFSIRPLAREQLLEVADKAKMTTVPIIYRGVDLIGGYTDLQDLLA
jgi:glutaredoxin